MIKQDSYGPAIALMVVYLIFYTLLCFIYMNKSVKLEVRFTYSTDAGYVYIFYDIVYNKSNFLRY